MTQLTREIAGRQVTIETGKMARQANGSVVVRCGNTVLLCTAVMSKTPRENIDFFPLTVEFSEKMYASGKIPGGFFKRETRPSLNATLTARLIDRPIRPCFPKNLVNDVQVVVTVLSYDTSFPAEALGIVGASAALIISDIPFSGPIAAVLVGRVNGEFIVNPSYAQLAESDLSIVVAGSADAILMVEAEANEVDEEIIVQAIQLAHRAIQEIVRMQVEFHSQCGKVKLEIPDSLSTPELDQQILDYIAGPIDTNFRSGDKAQIDAFLAALESEVVEKFVAETEYDVRQIKAVYNRQKKQCIRKGIIDGKIRPDGRSATDIRTISVDVGLLPSVHGSALFTRGETQSLAVTTLGNVDDEQIEDGLRETFRKNYYLHYNFPPFSVGEVGMLGRTGRREMGHGALAERAIKAVLPDYDLFPYTIRVVSEILESNGSSSMASVCAGSLSLMDCGVPIASPVSGIAMGLFMNESDYVILSDIQGLEDHYGDMDFKVAGTPKGITALQLDIKIAGLSEQILREAIAQAKSGRLYILEKMMDVLKCPRPELSATAPKIAFISIDPDKVGTIIGAGGKMIRRIEEDTRATVVITDGTAGKICISAANQTDLDKAIAIIQMLAKDVAAGDEFVDGRVTRITSFGAFVEVLPGKEGLMHISTLSKSRVNRVEDLLSLNQTIGVRVREIDSQHRINLVPITPFD